MTTAAEAPGADRATQAGPMTGRRVVCALGVGAGGAGRGGLAAARLLADMGATVTVVAGQGLDAVERRVLDRAPAVEIATVGIDEIGSAVAGASAVVHQGRVDPALRRALEAAGTNLVELLWVDENEGSDLTAQASAGTASIVGEPDREPLAYPHRMGEYLLGVNACGMVLRFELGGRRGAYGELYLSDVWAYATGTCGLMCTPKGIRYFREGRRSPGNGGVYPQRIFKAKDGYVALLCRSSKEWDAILRALDSPEWGENPRYRDILAMASVYPDEVDALVEAETVKHTRAELWTRAVANGFPLAAVREPLETLEDEFLGRQNFWDDRDGVRSPGSLWRAETWLPAPEPEAAESVASSPARTEQRLDLEGARVLDLSWVWAGPMVGSFLADLGADVIKVEHEKRLDNMRLRGRLPSAIKQEELDVDKREIDPLFHCVNRGKRSITLDMKNPGGRELFLELVKQSDIVLESFRPHVLASWGLDFEELRKVNPRIVLLSLRGLELDESFGPSGLRSYAPITSSLSGMESQIGYPDVEGPTGGMGLGVSDPVAGYHGLTLLLGALVHRVRTGNGGWVRLSQLETLASVLSEMYLEAQGVSAPGPQSHAERRSGEDVVVGPGEHTTPVREVSDLDRWEELYGRSVTTVVPHDLVPPARLYNHGWRIDGKPVAPTKSAPVIGADTDAVLTEYLGLDADRIAELKASGVLS